MDLAHPHLVWAGYARKTLRHAATSLFVPAHFVAAAFCRLVGRRRHRGAVRRRDSVPSCHRGTDIRPPGLGRGRGISTFARTRPWRVERHGQIRRRILHSALVHRAAQSRTRHRLHRRGKWCASRPLCRRLFGHHCHTCGSFQEEQASAPPTLSHQRGSTRVPCPRLISRQAIRLRRRLVFTGDLAGSNQQLWSGHPKAIQIAVHQSVEKIPEHSVTNRTTNYIRTCRSWC